MSWHDFRCNCKQCKPPKESSKMRKCEDCYYWEKKTEECRRYAPRPFNVEPIDVPTNGVEMGAFWPTTEALDGCGEFKKGGA